MNTYGATLGWQYTWGTANALLFPPAPITGSRNGKPNSNAFIFEADWIPFGKEDSWARPFVNLKIGLQYVAYTMFNGGTRNYDGFGRMPAAITRCSSTPGWHSEYWMVDFGRVRHCQEALQSVMTDAERRWRRGEVFGPRWSDVYKWCRMPALPSPR